MLEGINETGGLQLEDAIVGKQGLTGQSIGGNVDAVTGLKTNEPGAVNVTNSMDSNIQGNNPQQGQGVFKNLTVQEGMQASAAQENREANQERASDGGALHTGSQPQAQADPELQPITDFSQVDLQLGDTKVDASLLKSFGGVACEIGLNPKQARALTKWHVEMVREAQEKMIDAERQILLKAWGKNVDVNQGRINALLQRIERQPGLGNFSQELARSGAANNATVAQGLLAIANMFGEDRAGQYTGVAGQQKETAYEGILHAFEKARGKSF